MTDTLEEHKIPYYGPFSSMDDATLKSYTSAAQKAKDLPDLPQVVLLSPGCASFEMFNNEFDRGNQFKNLVGFLLEV